MRMDLIFALTLSDMREYDVTPQDQGSDCVYQSHCQFYKYGIWCNECTQQLEFDDIILDDLE